MKKQQVGDDSRLSLDQRFSGGARRPSSRLRHQSLDRGMGRVSLDQRFTRTAMEDSQAELQSLGQRTIGAYDKLQAAARPVCPSIPVALSVHCRSDEPDRIVDSTDEPDRNLDKPDESLEPPSLGQRTTCAGRGLPTTLSATVETKDHNRQPSTVAMLDQCDVVLPSTTVSTTVGSMDNIVVLEHNCYSQPRWFNSGNCCLLTTGSHHVKTAVE